MPNAHTLGPWAIEAAPNGYTYIRAKHRAEIALVGSENMLADDSSAASNARLIAAAPDLLKALRIGLYHTTTAANRARGLANWNANAGMDGIAAEYLKSAEEADAAAEVIRAAINKATGA